MSGSIRVQASKWGAFTTLCGYVGRGQQGEIERIRPPLTNSKNRLKSFCEVGYANFRPNFFAAGKRISMKLLVGMRLHAWCPVALKSLVAFSKNGNVQEIKLKCSTVRVICTYDQCDSTFCALQLTALIKLYWCVLLYSCACLHSNTIPGWITVPCPATNLSILICKSSARTKRD